MERRLLSTTEVHALRDPSWLADFIIPEASVSVLWGPSNIGKSFVTFALACSVATGTNWLERATEPGRAVYIAAEGVSSFRRRIGAWGLANNFEPDDLQNLKFVSWPVQLNQGVDTLLRVVRPFKPTLIIIDTLAASASGIVETTSEGMGPIMQSMLKLRKELGASVMAVHHSGWDGAHERGFSGLRGMVDTSIEVTGPKNWERTGNMKRTLVCWKQRDAEKFHDLDFELVQVEWLEGGWPKKSLIPVV